MLLDGGESKREKSASLMLHMDTKGMQAIPGDLRGLHDDAVFPKQILTRYPVDILFPIFSQIS